MAIAVLLLMALGIPAVSAGQTPVTRDSAGIRIIENERPAVGGDGRWAVVDSEPTLTIGQLDGPQPYLFSSVDRAYEAAGGRIVVADAGDLMSSHEVRVFDNQGSHIVTFGGVGEGPGEFIVGPVIRLVHPDTILAWDPRSRRFSWFGLDGELLMERTVRSPALPLLMHPTPWSLVPGGGVVVLDLPVGRAEFNGVATREASLFILPAGSTDPLWLVETAGIRWAYIPIPPGL